jgi:hypothetical protein
LFFNAAAWLAASLQVLWSEYAKLVLARKKPTACSQLSSGVQQSPTAQENPLGYATFRFA